MAVILFSPIGGTDPVSSTTEADGSMLHICRHYKPDKVYLYLSREMVERENKDHRYTWCIERLGTLINHSFDVKLIERENLELVYDFDFYYNEFHGLIGEIVDKMESEDRLLLNISSGTPAMKSELLITAVMSDKGITPIQVTTPGKMINEHRGKDLDYDPEYYWGVNKDNESDAENRCTEVKCPNLTLMLKKEIIARHVCAYDYSAALTLGKEIINNISEEAYSLIELAANRVQMNINKVTEIENKYGFSIRKKIGSDQSTIYEYTLMLGVKLKRNEYGDFIRAISPLLTDLFAYMLKNKYKIDIENMCKKTTHGDTLSREEMNKTDKGKEILQVLDNEFGGQGIGFKDTPLAASNLKPILCHYVEDSTVKKNIEDIRKIEEKVRNTLAHEIVSINDQTLKKMLDDKSITMKKVYDLIISIMIASGINANKDDLRAYDIMNEKIMETILK